jgi:hypothetical protein
MNEWGWSKPACILSLSLMYNICVMSTNSRPPPDSRALLVGVSKQLLCSINWVTDNEILKFIEASESHRIFEILYSLSWHLSQVGYLLVPVWKGVCSSNSVFVYFYGLSVLYKISGSKISSFPCSCAVSLPSVPLWLDTDPCFTSVQVLSLACSMHQVIYQSFLNLESGLWTSHSKLPVQY